MTVTTLDPNRSWSTKKGEGEGAAFLRTNMNYCGDDCLIWPFTRMYDGRGLVGFNGKMMNAHRLMCIFVHGDPPSKKHHAAHSCNNGHLGCVSPRHLSWNTQSENERYKYLSGFSSLSKGSRTKIPLETIAEIRATKDTVSIDAQAEKYGLKRGIVRYWRDSTHTPAAPGTSISALRKRRLRAVNS